jgi:hypothetical protein
VRDVPARGEETKQGVGTVKDTAIIGAGDYEVILVLEVCSSEPIPITPEVAGNRQQGKGIMHLFCGSYNGSGSDIAEGQIRRTE